MPNPDTVAGLDEASLKQYGFTDPLPDPTLIADLVVANHILFDQSVVDAFGHISVRHDKRPDRFFLARNMAPGQVIAEDLLELTLDREPVNLKGRRAYLERFIHGELLRSRPDVKSVVHSHSPSILPLAISKKTRLCAVFHMAGFIGQQAPLFEIREHGGDATDLLIIDPKLGRALAQNARYQCDALQLGEVEYLTEDESKVCVRNVEAQWHRPWALWKEQAAARRQAIQP